MFLLCAAAAVSFAGCTKDAALNGPGNGPSGLQGEGYGYLSLSINAEMTSRADALGRDDANDDKNVFDAGDEQEYALTSAMHTHIAIFFDEAGNYFGNSYLASRDAIQNGHGDNEGDDVSSEEHPNMGESPVYSTSERLFTYITKDPRITQKGVKPDQVLVLLNSSPARIETILDELTAGKTVYDIMQLIIEKTGSENDEGKPIYAQATFVEGNNTFFTMTNSTYTDDKGLRVATKIHDKVYESMELAANNPVTIFVERIVAKHTLAFYTSGSKEVDPVSIEGGTSVDYKPVPDENAPEGAEEATLPYVATYESGAIVSNNTPWTVHIVNWGANALENNTFLYKNLCSEGSQEVAFGGDWWKAYGFHRSYWAVDEHYKDGDVWFGQYHNYPTQYTPLYPAKESNDVTSWTGETIFDGSGAYVSPEAQREPDNDWSLIYLSYNKVGSRKSSIYTLENTFAYDKSLKGYGPLHYGTHIIVTAQLLLGDESGTQDDNGYISGVKTTIAAGGYYWAEDAYINYAYKNVSEYIANGVGHAISSIFDKDEVYEVYPADDDYRNALYVKDGSDYKKIVTSNPGAGEVAATEVFRLDETYLENGDGKRSLKENQTVYIHAYTAYDGDSQDADFKSYNTAADWVELDEKTFASVVNNLLPEGAKYYNEGRMYYAIPIKHIDNTTLGNNTIAKYDGDEPNEQGIIPGKYDEGDFGVVRNHWYRLNLLTISKPGTPVEDPDDPIIPNDPEENDYLGVEIVILPWHVIEQDINL